jgi:hypothetical protein
MAFKLTYGDGIAGRHYSLLLGEKYFPLNEMPTLGRQVDEDAARAVATQILTIAGSEHCEEAQTAPFEWDGTI